MNILSLFDGGSMGQVALKKVGVNIDNYFASEIDKHAIKVTMNNHPNTIQIGDVRKISFKNGTLFTENGNYDIGKIDLVMGGSPCQGFSFSGKLLNFKDPRSKLFFEFVRILKEIQPKHWMLENVVMKKEFQDVISEHLGVQPIKLNSSLTSAQNRVRLYWCNFNIVEPKDMNISLFSILDDLEMCSPAAIRGRNISVELGGNGRTTQCLEVKSKNRNKSNCLTTVSKDTVLTSMSVGRYIDVYNKNFPYRNYTKAERCKLMNLPENYCEDVSYSQTVKITGNGWEVGMIEHIFKQIYGKK